MYEGLNAGQITLEMQRSGFTQEGLNRIYELRRLGPAPRLPPALIGARRGQGRDHIRIYDAQGRVMTGASRSSANSFFNNFYQTAVDPFKNFDTGNWLGTIGMIVGGAAAGVGAGAAGGAGGTGGAVGGTGGAVGGAAGGGGAGALAGALPEIVVTGYTGGGALAGAAGAAAGAAGGLSGINTGTANSNYNGNYGESGGLNQSGDLGIFGDGGQGGIGSLGQGNVGDLYANTGINTGGVGGVGGTGNSLFGGSNGSSGGNSLFGGTGSGGGNMAWDWDTIINTGGTLLGAYMQGQGGKDAADASAAGALAAVDETRRQYDQSRTDQMPWLEAGRGALNRLNDPGANFTASPDYAFRREEGTRDIGNSFASRGGALSGNALRSLTEFNSGLAGGEFNNWWNRQAGLAGVGQTTATNLGNLGASAAGQVGNALQNGANARASGIVDQTNAYTGGLADLLSQYNRRNTSPNTYRWGGG